MPGVFLVHRAAPFRVLGDLRRCAFAFDSLHSNSGMNLPRRALAALAGGRPFSGSVVDAQGQPGNIERVASGEVDATCVDCVTYAFFRRHRPRLGALTRVLLFAVAPAPDWAAARAGLLLADILPPEPRRYAVQQAYVSEAAALGYPVLA